jgi:hypothetical protein
MDITLNITTDNHWDFYTEFDKLGELQKQIWMTTCWWVKRFPLAFPKQQKIADEVGCTRKHVNNTFKKFKQLGWLHLMSRGARRAKVLGVPHYLVVIDPYDRKAFRKVEVTSEVTHSISNIKRNTSSMPGVFSNKFGQKIGPPDSKIEIPDHLMKTKLSLKKKLKLALLPENIYHNALESTKLQHSLKKIGNDPDRIERYMIGTAFRMAKNASIPINWSLYYDECQRLGI